MKLTIDTASGVLSKEVDGERSEAPLYSREAFEAISREWVRVGWAANYYFTMTWFGRPILQLPEDLVRLQEVIFAGPKVDITDKVIKALNAAPPSTTGR